jgi:signal transduction histidine kinase
MNGVLDKDAALIERARTHVGNLAHGLKTSLAIASAELGGANDRTVLAGQLEAMRRLVEHHLGRASAIAGAGRTMGARVPLRPVAESIAAALAKVFAERRLTIDLDIDAAVAFRGHREDLEEILGNLMENACKWARSRILVSARDDGQALALSIDDDGPGMPQAEAEDAARRGRRLDENVPGWGLGLAIVSDLVQVNGGEMRFRRSALGGLSVALRMPYP